MFGIIRPCRRRLGEELRDVWRAHLCGMCLALRDDHGQLARLATNYDGLIVSVLAEAQAPAGEAPGRRTAGPCPLRGMRRASVATGDCARLAATVSLVLAAAKVRDHAEDADGIAGRPGLRQAAGALARNWEAHGTRVGTQLGFDVTVLTEAVSRQEALEAQAGPGTALLAITEPTETATGAAFGYTAILAGRPGNEAALAEAGRLFGRIAHLLDAVEDQAADAARGAWNPIAATGTPLSEVRRLCEDAVSGIRLALADADLADRRMVDALLDHELRRAVRTAFRHTDTQACPTISRGADSRTAAGRPALAALVTVTAFHAPRLAAVTGLCAPAYPEEGPRRRRRGGGCCGDCCCDCCSECACDACCEGCCGSIDCCSGC